jgi:glutamyl-tRNA synthetase
VTGPSAAAATTPVDVRHLAAPPLDAAMRCRIAPAPSGDLHVGNVRTALYNWALARRHGGTFILRVEDTDRSRATDEAFAALQEILHWAGLSWDEGPGVGGPHAPYRQSERVEEHRAAARRLEEDGAAYRCYCTPAELAARRAAATAAGRPAGYDGRCRTLSAAERAGFEQEGRSHVLRFAMPPGQTTWNDLVRGEVTIRHEDVPDFAIARSDGAPLYLLAAAVDDLAMGLTHIVRGEDLVPATPRQLALYAALGQPQARWPAFGHLPLIVGEDHRPLSKRNGEVSLAFYRRAGFLPEAVMNYLALLGWSLPGDTEVFSLPELSAAFTLDRVSRNPARFDIRKLEAINGEWIRRLEVAELTARLRPFLTDAGLPERPDVLAAAVPLARERMTTLVQAPGLLGYLLVGDDELRMENPEVLTADALVVLEAAHAALAAVPDWSTAAIEAALRAALTAPEGLGLKPKTAFTAVRVAVSGRRVSLPLFESLELLGRDSALARLAAAARLARSH